MSRVWIVGSKIFGIFCALMLNTVAFSQTSNGYYRWPNVNRDTVVFSAEGDLWRGSISDERAIRLTSHAEMESQPALSPDGKFVAFLASYDAAREIYVMPISGGSPKQVSFVGGGVSVRGWTSDGRVIYVSTAVGRPSGRLIQIVDPQTFITETLPLANANAVSFSGDGKTIFFSLFGLANKGDHAKYYRGGGMAQLWKFDKEGKSESVRLASNFNAPIRNPMWRNKRVYFLSDKSGINNIWSVNEDGEDNQQHTDFKDWGVRDVHLTGDEIAFQRKSDIYVYDLKADTSKKLTMKLISDQDGRRVRWLNDPLKYLTSARFSPKGDKVALTARGKIAIALPGKMRRAEMDISVHGRARNAVMSADGKSVYAIIDDGIRGEIWEYPASGLGKPTQITKNATAHRWNIYPSPHGKYILHDDDNAQLWLYNIATKTNKAFDLSGGSSGLAFSGVSWSPSNRYVAYEKANLKGITQIVLADLKTFKKEIITTDKFESFSPAFSTDNDWLYFLSNRTFNATPYAPWGDRNMGPQFNKRTKIYALSLNKEAHFPFQIENEVTNEQSEKKRKRNEKKVDEGKKDKEDIEVLWGGLTKRLYEVPGQSGNYSALKITEKFLYFLDRDGRCNNLKSLEINSKGAKQKTFADKVTDFNISADGQKIFYQLCGRNNSGPMFIVNSGGQAPKDNSQSKIRTQDWKISLKPDEEWKQLFLDAWRLHRDIAFDGNMRGVDWNAVREKYEPLVARVGHRAELDDLLGLMISELGILHSQVRNSDYPEDDEKASFASLGAKFTQVKTGLRVTHIYRSEPDMPNAQSPLAKPGVDIQIGDVIFAVNDEKTPTKADLYNVLLQRANQQVILHVKRGFLKETKVVVTPIDANANRYLLYTDWVQNNREVVATSGKGDIGYLHIRAMGGRDIANFARDYYDHTEKGGIVIDVRGNLGGNVDSWILQTLMRKVWSFWHFEGRNVPYGNMQNAFRGHLVVLTNEATYSDGETFAAGIKALDIAPIIGTRTTGAGIWLSDRNRLSDGGIARIAESAQYGLDGRWLIEGRGIDPDIEVVNLPHAEYLGEDKQLESAIAYLRKKLIDEPIKPLKSTPIPRVGISGQDVK